MAQTNEDLQAAIAAPDLPDHLRTSCSLTFPEFTSLLDFANFVAAMDINDSEATFALMRDWAREAKELLANSAHSYELEYDRGGVQKRSEERVIRVRRGLLLEAKVYAAEYSLAQAKERLEEYRAREQEVRPHQLEVAASGLDAILDTAMEEILEAVRSLSPEADPELEPLSNEEVQIESNSSQDDGVNLGINGDQWS